MKFQTILILGLVLSSCMHHSDSNRVYAFRLHPGQDLKQELIAFIKAQHLEAAYIITCVGSLKKASLRLANQPQATSYEGKYEIVSLVGTLAAESGVHIHMAISDSTGTTIGGHLMHGNLIYTTAEIVLGEATELRFLRKPDSITTYQELSVEPKEKK